MPKGKAKAERAGKYRISGGGQPDKEVKKNIKKAQRVPTRMVNPKRTELGDFLYDNENSDTPMRELIQEFRNGCPHSFVEIAHLVKDNKRHTYQTCRRCGLFATNKKAVS